MGSLNPFKKPKVQTPTPVAAAPATPALTESAEDIALAQEEGKQKRRKQRGRASTILSRDEGVLGDDSAGLATKTLLGG